MKRIAETEIMSIYQTFYHMCFCEVRSVIIYGYGTSDKNRVAEPGRKTTNKTVLSICGKVSGAQRYTRFTFVPKRVGFLQARICSLSSAANPFSSTSHLSKGLPNRCMDS